MSQRLLTFLLIDSYVNSNWVQPILNLNVVDKWLAATFKTFEKVCLDEILFALKACNVLLIEVYLSNN